MPVVDQDIAINRVTGPVVMNTQHSSSYVVTKALAGYRVTYIPMSGGVASSSALYASLEDALKGAGILEYRPDVKLYNDGVPA